MEPMSIATSAQQLWEFINSKLDSKKVRVVLGGIGICYISVRVLRSILKRHYDRVKYVTLGQVLSSRKKYDFIIVGAGTAGSALAGTLARDSRRPKVLLIEAGDKDSYSPLSTQVVPAFAPQNQNTSNDWQYCTVPQKKGFDAMRSKQALWSRGKVCGGTSVLNYMMWVRGNPEDYNEWADVYGCNGWSWKDIVPIFRSLERCIFTVKNAADRRVRGFDGLQTVSKKVDADQPKHAQAFVEAAQEAGYKFNDDYNGVTQDGVSYVQYNIDENGRRLTSFRAFVATLFDENEKYDIDILPNVHVTKILSKDDPVDNLKVAYGVQVNGDKSQNIYIDQENNGEIVISGGTVNSPQLLMLSGIGDSEELQRHGIDVTCPVPGVGKNMRDHVLQMFPVTFNAETRNGGGILHGAGVWGVVKALAEYVIYGTGMLSSMCCDVQLFTKSAVAKRDGLKSNDLQLVIFGLGQGESIEDDETFYSEHFNYDLRISNFLRWPFKSQYTADQLKKKVQAASCLQKPKSVGTVSLKSADPFDKPVIDPKYLSHPDDISSLLEGWRTLTGIYNVGAMKAAGAEIMEWAQFETHEDAGKFLISNNCWTMYHPVGTCKMGKLSKDKMAVCSERLKVRGFKNLRVADASIAPMTPSGNTQAMCTMIGCKAANMLMEDWQ